jgi:hypothetical protein
LWIEFKRVKGGVLSEQQQEFAKYVIEKCNDYWMLAEGFEDGKRKLIGFGIK